MGFERKVRGLEWPVWRGIQKNPIGTGRHIQSEWINEKQP
jgi:hypothetical protein